MSPSVLDPYQDRDSPVHALDARVKLAVAVSMLLAISLTPIEAWPGFLFLACLIVSTAIAARVPLPILVTRSALVLPFVLMAAMGVPFVRSGRPLLTYRLFDWRLVVTDVGLMRFVTTLARSFLSILVAVVLSFTTHFLELSRAMSSFGVPKLLSAIITMMYRYLFVLVDEAQRLMRARQARSAEMASHSSGGTVLWRANVTGHMIGVLFLRTYERSERIYQAMLARGYSGEVRALGQGRLSREQALIGALVSVGLVASAVIVRVYW